MKKYLLLIAALIIGFYLRFHLLSTIPGGLTWDEAALGYNAYSILKTGRDEFGQFMPLIFKSFGDYKPGLYVYLAVPAVAVFGLTEFAVRFPSAIFGLLGILAVYLLIKEIFSEEKNAHTMASLSALALAISPWHVHFSRGAWEVNVFSTLLAFGLYYLIRFIKGRSSLLPTIIFACAALVCYQAAKLLTPLLYLAVIIIFWKPFWQETFTKFKYKINYVPFVLGSLFAGWLFIGSTFGPAGNRLTRLSIFGYRPGISQETKDIDNNNPITLALYHNQQRFTFGLITSRYLYHFSPEVLFYEGKVTTERGHIPDLGMLNPLEFIWIIGGIIFLATKWPKRSSILVISLLVLSPVPASLTLEEFSTVRALFMTLPLAMISGLGMYYLVSKLKLLSLPVVLAYILIFVYTFDIYFVHTPKLIAKEFNFGYKQAMEFVNQYPAANKVVITDVLGQPYIYYLFYSKYDPATYQKQNNFVSGGVDVGSVGSIGKVEFHQFGVQDILTQKNTVFVGSVGNIPDNFDPANPVVENYRSVSTYNDSVVFRMVKTR